MNWKIMKEEQERELNKAKGKKKPVETTEMTDNSSA